MKTAIVVISIAVVVHLPLRAQVRFGLAKEPSTPQTSKEIPDPASGVVGAYPICGSLLLHDQEQSLLQYLAAHPEAGQPSLKKSAAWGFTVGSTHAWYAYDYSTTNQYLTNATCRAVGVHCYIFVEDSMWTTGKVDQGVVDSVMNTFDNSVPSNSSKGVYQMDVDAFGNPPDVDNDPRIIILILNIRDGWSGSGGYIEGYFYGLNEVNVAGSNNAEIYFLDAYPTNLKSSAGLRSGMSTTAHEFQHMIHWNYNKSQISFVNEGCSLVAEVNCGYPIYSQFYFASEPNHYLLDWRGSNINLALFDYSRAARYFTYLRDQFGMGIFPPIVQSAPHIGINSISDGLAAVSSPRQFTDVYLDWAIANTLDDRSVDPRYGYLYPGLEKVATEVRLDPNLPSTAEWIQPLGAKYVSFTAGTNLTLTATASSPNIIAKAVAIGSPGAVTQLTSGIPFNVPNFGTTYGTVTLALMNTSAVDSQQVTIQATGNPPPAVALAYENQEPTRYLSLAHGDTVCVVFDGVTGAHLDSVRVALRSGVADFRRCVDLREQHECSGNASLPAVRCNRGYEPRIQPGDAELSDTVSKLDNSRPSVCRHRCVKSVRRWVHLYGGFHRPATRDGLAPTHRKRIAQLRLGQRRPYPGMVLASGEHGHRQCLGVHDSRVCQFPDLRSSSAAGSAPIDGPTRTELPEPVQSDDSCQRTVDSRQRGAAHGV